MPLSVCTFRANTSLKLASHHGSTHSSSSLHDLYYHVTSFLRLRDDRRGASGRSPPRPGCRRNAAPGGTGAGAVSRRMGRLHQLFSWIFPARARTLTYADVAPRETTNYLFRIRFAPRGEVDRGYPSKHNSKRRVAPRTGSILARTIKKRYDRHVYFAGASYFAVNRATSRESCES